MNFNLLSFRMKFSKLTFIAILFAIVSSCTLDKTDFEAEINREVTDTYEFKEVFSIKSEDYSVSMEALNGLFHKGYNEIRLKISDMHTSQAVKNGKVTFLPVMTDLEEDNSSCPHSYHLKYNSSENYYYGYVVFTNESSVRTNWNLLLTLEVGDRSFSVKQPVAVREQTNKNLNMTTFIGKDKKQYMIALVEPLKPKVAENELIAGIYEYNGLSDSLQLAYTEVSNYTLVLDPRMPEPSMGNHSSPNNKNLTQKASGLYYGVVNYTMTGNWTLNFIMLNAAGEVVKGTEVPSDFTPGVNGIKSELFIDILF